jgi:predicted RNA-binding Zn ribbon-like protein
MVETPPTAANMRLDGGHPALDLVNTIYGQVGQPPEHDVLQTPEDLATFARRVGVGDRGAAIESARNLRAAAEAAFRYGECDPLTSHARAAYTAGSLQPGGWTWPAHEPMSVVHRLAHAATQLLANDDLDRLRGCDDCCWLYLDRSKNRSRKWCSMADCGTNAKKRRYIEKRRSKLT